MVQVYPYEVLLSPGEKATFKARLFDAKGNFIREDKATWALDQLGGAVADGVYTASAESEGGYIKATVGGVTGQARVRVVPPLPWSFDFDTWTGEAPPKHWTNTTGKVFVREFDGSKGLTRVPDATPQRRTRVFMGPSTWSNYTVEADVRVTEKRRTLSDVGVIAQRYGLVLFGNSQKIELQPWQAVPGRSATVPFAWKPDTLVPDEASGAERGRRRHRRARQGVAARRGRAGRLDHREEGRHRTSRGRAGAVFRSGQ